jgi:hypothetical protein
MVWFRLINYLTVLLWSRQWFEDKYMHEYSIWCGISCVSKHICVFRFDTITNIYAKANLELFDYTFAINEIFFTTSKTSNYSIQLMTGNYDFISTVPLISGQQCFNCMQDASIGGIPFNTTINQFLFQDLTLNYSPIPLKRH